MLDIGSAPADFALQDAAGREVPWSSFRGRPLVVFVYPKADTPGCTREACAFRDLRAEFERLGVAVVGLSADPPRRQAAFTEKYGLTMPLLADPDKAVLSAWGAFGEKRSYGKVTQGIIRSTFLFDAEGVLRRAWRAVKVDGHAEAVLKAAGELGR